MIGIKYLKYFPQETYRLQSGLTLDNSSFSNSDGYKGVVAGPHPAFNQVSKDGQSHLNEP